MEFLSLSFEQRGTLEDMSKLDFVPRPESRVSAGTATSTRSATVTRTVVKTAEACAALDGRSTRRVRRRT